MQTFITGHLPYEWRLAMGLHYFDLNARTRELMISEIEADIASREGVYISSYLTTSGVNAYPGLMLDAARSGTDNSFASSLNAIRAFREHTERSRPGGRGMTLVRVPRTAAQTLAESQFNMYYIRAVCLRAIEEGREIEVYRARASSNPRPESEQMIGTYPDPERTLEALRDTKGVNPPNGIPKPNSGLSVRLV